MPYQDAYENNHVDFEIAKIRYEEDARPREEEVAKQEELAAIRDDLSGYIERRDAGTNPYFSEDQYDRLIEQTRGRIQDVEDEIANQELPSIQFTYAAPSISVDTAGRFATHEIIGGATVRQKIGEDPIEVTINGVCTEDTARDLDRLRDAEFGTLITGRLPGESLDVHFASTSTSPLEDGGAVALSDDDGEFLYTYTLSTVEVVA